LSTTEPGLQADFTSPITAPSGSFRAVRGAVTTTRGDARHGELH